MSSVASNRRHIASPVGYAARVRALVMGTGAIRARDLAREGLPRMELTRLTRAGAIERVARGLYVSPSADLTEHHDLVLAAKRVPAGIVCLLAALRFHGLTTQQPHEVWLTLPRTARKPTGGYPPLRIVRGSGRRLREGIETHLLEGVPVRVTTAARTVADCFRYRNKIGVDIAVEALRDYHAQGAGTLDTLWKAAQLAGVARVLTPYAQMLQ